MSRPRHRAHRTVRRVALGPVAALLLATACLACGPRYARLAVVDQGGIRVTLRSQQSRGEGVDRGFAHPATISGVRLAHILARIDVRLREGKSDPRQPGVPTELVYGLGEAMSKAFAAADPSQEVVVQALRTERNLGVFTQKYLTGLVAWFEGEELVIHLSHVDSRVTKSGKNDRLPEPWPGQTSQDFKVLPATHMVPRGPHALAVRWRAAAFRQLGAVRRDAQGRVQRRTILLESPEPAVAAPEPAPAAALPLDLSPQSLRALADLEELRQAGGIAESEYQRRREALLRGEPAAAP